MQSILLGAGMLAALAVVQAGVKEPRTAAPSKFYSFSMKTIDGKQKSLGEYRGKVLLVVNVASECGYTPQYADLESIYRKYKDRGFVVLGFPANNFGRQEPGSDADIKQFCTTKFGVTFDMFSKISVAGDDQHPLYRYLTHDTPFKGDVKWNFQKYLVDRNGNVSAMFLSAVKPTDPEITGKIEALLDR